jgi:hypothetical protein
MAHYDIELSRQDLAEFLDENEQYMESYRAELEAQLATGGDTASVEITDTLTDKFWVDDDIAEHKDVFHIQAIMAYMANELDDILGV